MQLLVILQETLMFDPNHRILKQSTRHWISSHPFSSFLHSIKREKIETMVKKKREDPEKRMKKRRRNNGGKGKKGRKEWRVLVKSQPRRQLRREGRKNPNRRGIQGSWEREKEEKFRQFFSDWIRNLLERRIFGLVQLGHWWDIERGFHWWWVESEKSWEQKFSELWEWCV